VSAALTVIIVILLAAGVRVVTLYLWPYGPCRKCEGSGRNRGSKRARFGQCRRCEGAGRRIRYGARAVHRGRVALAERRKARR
jgi:DnaJ-class molecular chaperone